jgi:hypothetical protein
LKGSIHQGNASFQPVLEHVGISVAAITGVLAARGKRIDLFGVFVLALVTAFGGGTVRDLVAGDLPPVWLRTSDYLLRQQGHRRLEPLRCRVSAARHRRRAAVRQKRNFP